LGHLRPFVRELVTCKEQHRFEPVSTFGQMLSHVPEAKQGNAHPKSPVEIPGLKEPVQSRAKVVMLHVATVQPSRAFEVIQFRISFFSQNQAVSRVGSFRCRFFPALSQPLKRIFTDSFKHLEAWFLVSALPLLH
jgi:hypothetical protein